MFDFNNVQAFDAHAESLLPNGDHLVRINSAQAGLNKNNNLELAVEASNASGKRTDWIYYGSEFGQSKVVALCQATGVRLPSEGDWDENGVLTDAYTGLFVGKQGGMVVRDDTYEGVTRPKVKGWVHPSQLGTDTPADMPVNDVVADDDDIPF